MHFEKFADARAFDSFGLGAAVDSGSRLQNPNRFELGRAFLPFPKITWRHRHTIADERAKRRVLFPDHDDGRDRDGAGRANKTASTTLKTAEFVADPKRDYQNHDQQKMP